MSSLVNVEAACPICGQFMVITCAAGTSEDERQEMALNRCGCTGAERRRQIKYGEDVLEQVCGADSMENGFDYAVADDVIAAARYAIEWIVDDRVRSVLINAPMGDVITIKMGIDKIKVGRTCKKQLTI